MKRSFPKKEEKYQILKNEIKHYQRPSSYTIFNPQYKFPDSEKEMRRVFFQEMRYLLNKCEWEVPSTLVPFLFPKKKNFLQKIFTRQKYSLPMDLDPMSMKGRIFFLDYMNIFPHYFKDRIFSVESTQHVHRGTMFKNKIQYLRNPDYLIGLIHYTFLKMKVTDAPTEDDWIIIITQNDGKKECGDFFFQKIPFLNNLSCLIMEVPCLKNRGIPFKSESCHIGFHKNEVDDYFLLYFILYLLDFRKLVEEYVFELEKTRAPFHDEIIKYKKFLKNQTLYLLSNDQYRWSDKIFSSSIKKETPWFGVFSLGRRG